MADVIYKSALPFDLNIHRNGEIIAVIKPSLPPATLVEDVVVLNTILLSSRPVSIRGIRYDGDSNLPPAQDNVFIITNRVVAAAYPERKDLLFPHGDIRDAEGRVIGCTSLAKFF